MKVAIIGNGGRENALAYKIAKSNILTKLYVLPGNPGTLKYGENINITDNEKIVNFCLENKIDLVVIGPEKPLTEGLADILRNNGIPVFGPSKLAAEIEGSKSFAKDLMQKYNIPTAKYKVFNKEQVKEAKDYLREHAYPLVIKASGLAAGKGVAICNNYEEAENYLIDLFIKNIFGEAGSTVVIEEFMLGEEASIFAITDGKDFILLPAAQDHKRALDGDKGKNTGGMGAYAPAPIVNNDLVNKIATEIVKPTIEAMNKENRTFIGCLYCGLMINDGEAKVVEYNCRFGDPETQAVLPLIEGDFLQLIYSAATGNLDKNSVKYNNGCAVCVVLASKGYPETYEKGFLITGIEEIEDENTLVFHSGTEIKNGVLVTSGGRVLNIININKENNLKHCQINCYNKLIKVKYSNIYYRRDIADKGIKFIKNSE